MYSLLIKNATIIDGSGALPIRGDVAIEQEKIVRIAPNINSAALTTIEAHGLVLAPGFIDIQNHSDSHWQLIDNPALESLVAQGYTTVLVGNSGASLAPIISPNSLFALQKWHTLSGTNINWQSFAEFAKAMQAVRFGCNVTSLIGYSTLRRGLVGDRTNPLTEKELASIQVMAEQSLREGAFGISTGLSYTHEALVGEDELKLIARITEKYAGLLAVQLRNEYDQVVDSTREVVLLAQQSGANTKISHLKVRYRENWPLLSEVLEEIEIANHQGTNLHFDAYPYNYTWQPLYSYLPRWVKQGGRAQIIATLRQPEQRHKVLTRLINAPVNIANLIIASTSNNIHVIGKTMSAIASDMGTTSEEAMLQIIEHGGSEVLVFDHAENDQIVEEICFHPLSFIGTNGSGYSMSNKKMLVHPRCFGTAPRFLSSAITTKHLSLQEAIRKLTGGPAKKIGLDRRGLIAEKYFADLVLFDPETIADQATITNPYQYPRGLEYVIVNGQIALQSGQLTTTLSGKFITK